MADRRSLITMSSSGETPSLPVYTWDDIEKHKSAESLWVVIDGKVYDVTAFKEEVCLKQVNLTVTAPFQILLTIDPCVCS